jgi:hypothetical protein
VSLRLVRRREQIAVGPELDEPQHIRRRLGRTPAELKVAEARRRTWRAASGWTRSACLVSKRRGRPSNNRLPEAYRELALSLVRERYADFGPTLAAEKLAEVHGCTISRETLRGWVIAEGL